MRGQKNQQDSMLSLRTPEDRVPKDHPLRRVKDLADGALSVISAELDKMYSDRGRPSIPPEQLLKASLLMAFYSVRSERLFCEQLDYNLLFRWFLDMGIEEKSFDHSTFSRNRERLMEHDIARKFFRAVVDSARKQQLMSSEHFSVDGTLIDAWASFKSFKPKSDVGGKDGDGGSATGSGNEMANWKGEKRSNDTHESKTDPEARLYTKNHGVGARLRYCANALMENRNGLLVDLRIDTADGIAEREGALAMLSEHCANGRSTVGADKAYDTHNFTELCRAMGVTPHVAKNTNRRRGESQLDGRTTRHEGYAVSLRIRKRIEEIFGWMKEVGNFRKTRFRGRRRTSLSAYLVGAAYNLMRLARLSPAAA